MYPTSLLKTQICHKKCGPHSYLRMGTTGLVIELLREKSVAQVRVRLIVAAISEFSSPSLAAINTAPDRVAATRADEFASDCPTICGRIESECAVKFSVARLVTTPNSAKRTN